MLAHIQPAVNNNENSRAICEMADALFILLQAAQRVTGALQDFYFGEFARITWFVNEVKAGNGPADVWAEWCDYLQWFAVQEANC